jgi:hypothetical protein
LFIGFLYGQLARNAPRRLMTDSLRISAINPSQFPLRQGGLTGWQRFTVIRPHFGGMRPMAIRPRFCTLLAGPFRTRH